MTRKEAERLTRQSDVLQSLGFTSDEADALRRISMTLRRWHELECGTDTGCIERDEKTGKPVWYHASIGKAGRYPIADHETGAKRRLSDILARRNGSSRAMLKASLTAYIQTDPRGAALYILRPGDVPAGESADAYYTRGICVY